MDRDLTTGREGQLRVDASIPDAPPIVAKLRRFRSIKLVWIVLALTMAVFSVAPIVNVVRGARFNKDYDLWQQVGRAVLAGEDVYPRTVGLFPFMYPPSCAALLAPLSPLPRGLFVGSLLLINSVSWVVCILASVYLATGRLKGNPPELFFWPSMAIVPFVHDTYLLGQPALLLLALLLGSFVLIRQNRPWRAGALVAVAAGIKAYPILAIGYFIYRRQWRATASVVVTLLALMFVVPTAFRSPTRVAEDFMLWSRGMLLKYDERTIAQRPDRAYSFKNQSIQATVHRLARPVLADGEADRSWRVNLVSLDFRATTVVMLGSLGALGLFYLWSTWRMKDAPPHDAVDQALISLMILMVAPLSFNYSYSWLMYPFTLLMSLWFASRPETSPHKAALFGIAGAVALLAATIPSPRVAQAYGNVFFSGLFLFVVIGIVCRKGWHRWAADPVPTPPPTPHVVPASAVSEWSI